MRVLKFLRNRFTGKLKEQKQDVWIKDPKKLENGNESQTARKMLIFRHESREENRNGPPFGHKEIELVISKRDLDVGFPALPRKIVDEDDESPFMMIDFGLKTNGMGKAMNLVQRNVNHD